MTCRIRANKGEYNSAYHCPHLPQMNGTDWTKKHPFLCYAFLKALEDSGSVGGQTGWDMLFLAAREMAQICWWVFCLRIKHHSYGEYVFDHSWAHAFERAGGRYYQNYMYRSLHPSLALVFYMIISTQKLSTTCSALKNRKSNQISSAHVNFITDQDHNVLKDKGWMIRTGVQFHWQNNNYNCFDDFLASLSSRKRKTLRKERQPFQKGIISSAYRH